MKRFYADIAKTEAQEDGTIKVWGFASSEATDSDGEVITADAMKAALPDYMRFGAVREMHDAKKAAGTAIEADVQDDGRTWFGAHVVDPVAVKKVESGTYKGFSIGGKVTARDKVNKNTITGLNLIEVSLVDRPANPEAVFECFKAEAPPEDEVETEGGEAVAKGLYGVSRFATMLNDLSYAVADAEWEAQGEGDKSPVPAALRDWFAQGLVVFQAMAKEEADECAAELARMASKAGKTDDLAKAGARFSAATKAALKAAQDAVRAADKAMTDLNYEDDDADDAKAAEPDLTKAAQDAEAIGEIAKAAGLTLAEPTEGALTKAALTALVELRKTHAELLASPAAPKGVAKGMVVDKTTDRGDAANNEPEPVTKSDGSVDDAATLIKAAHARPIRIA